MELLNRISDSFVFWMSTGGTTRNDNCRVDNAKPFYVDWSLIHVFCLTTVSQLVDLFYNEYLPEVNAARDSKLKRKHHFAMEKSSGESFWLLFTIEVGFCDLTLLVFVVSALSVVVWTGMLLFVGIWIFLFGQVFATLGKYSGSRCCICHFWQMLEFSCRVLVWPWSVVRYWVSCFWSDSYNFCFLLEKMHNSICHARKKLGVLN